MCRFNQLNFQQVKYIGSKVSRCPQNWGDIAVVITVAILGYISVALNCIKFLTLSHAFFTLLAPLPQKMKYLGFSSKCIVLCDALILVLRGRGYCLQFIQNYFVAKKYCSPFQLNYFLLTRSTNVSKFLY